MRRPPWDDMKEAPLSVVLLGIVLGTAFVVVGLVGLLDWRGWNTAMAVRNADLRRMTGERRRRFLAAQRVLGRVLGLPFVAVGAVVLVLPVLSRLL